MVPIGDGEIEMAKAVTRKKNPVPARQPVENQVRHYRKRVLGLSKAELARSCKVSEKTIYRIEQKLERFREDTYDKVLIGINKLLSALDKAEVTMKDLFPGLL